MSTLHIVHLSVLLYGTPTPITFVLYQYACLVPSLLYLKKLTSLPHVQQYATWHRHPCCPTLPSSLEQVTHHMDGCRALSVPCSFWEAFCLVGKQCSVSGPSAQITCDVLGGRGGGGVRYPAYASTLYSNRVSAASTSTLIKANGSSSRERHQPRSNTTAQHSQQQHPINSKRQQQHPNNSKRRHQPLSVTTATCRLLEIRLMEDKQQQQPYGKAAALAVGWRSGSWSCCCRASYGSTWWGLWL